MEYQTQQQNIPLTLNSKPISPLDERRDHELCVTPVALHCAGDSVPVQTVEAQSQIEMQQVAGQQVAGQQCINTANTIDFTTPLPFLDYNKELDIEIKSSKPLSGKQYLLLIPITKFFKKYRNIYLLINILNGRSIISLRLIEYFVVNYVLENNTHYNLTKYRNRPEFIVYNLFTAGPPTIDITSESMTPVANDSQSLKDEIRMSILEKKIKANLQITTPVQAVTVCTGTESPAQCNATGVTHNSRLPFSLDGFAIKQKENQLHFQCNGMLATHTVCTGLQAQCNATGVTPILRPPGVGLEFNVSGMCCQNKKGVGLEFSVSGMDSTTNNFDDYFLVHDNYKCQLKEYNKKNFDPFCRWTRIRMYYDKTKFFYTTVAQLNFFKWAIENYVLDYILDNLVMIEKAMNDYERAIKKEKKIRKLNMQQSIPLTVTDASDIGSLSQCSSTSGIGVKPIAQAPIISNTELNIDIDMIPNTIISAQLQQNQQQQNHQQPNQLAQIASGNTGKKITHALFSTLDKKSKIKGRKKKEFTKTNRSILKYTCTKIVNFD